MLVDVHFGDAGRCAGVDPFLVLVIVDHHRCSGGNNRLLFHFGYVVLLGMEREMRTKISLNAGQVNGWIKCKEFAKLIFTAINQSWPFLLKIESCKD